MRFNKGKCKVLHWGRNNYMNQYSLEIDLLDRSSAKKYLSVPVKNRLSVSQQYVLWAKKDGDFLGCIKKSMDSR